MTALPRAKITLVSEIISFVICIGRIIWLSYRSSFRCGTGGSEMIGKFVGCFVAGALGATLALTSPALARGGGGGGGMGGGGMHFGAMGGGMHFGGGGFAGAHFAHPGFSPGFPGSPSETPRFFRHGRFNRFAFVGGPFCMTPTTMAAGAGHGHRTDRSWSTSADITSVSEAPRRCKGSGKLPGRAPLPGAMTRCRWSSPEPGSLRRRPSHFAAKIYARTCELLASIAASTLKQFGRGRWSGRIS